jgi:peptidoglycan/LPS O-acetylase OafA/YrhL
VAAGASLEALVVGSTTLICVQSMRSARLNRWADVRPLQFLGRISYSLYLFHGMVLGRGATLLLTLLAGIGGGTAVAALGMLLLLAGSVVFAFVMHRIIEVPTLQLSRRIGKAGSGQVATVHPVPA